MSLRTVATLLKKSRPSTKLTKIECRRYRVGTELLNGQGGGCVTKMQPKEMFGIRTTDTDFETLKEIKIDHCPTSVTISWSVSDYDEDTNVPSKEVLNMERVMKEAFHNTATTRPFFVLDGKGRRMALLSLL
eukprot:jgi/Psemu1/199031/e_gw1.230.17.1